MAFNTYQSPPQLQSRLGEWTVTVLGSDGIRLTDGTHFHLDEGPKFVYLSIYRAAADARQIDIVRKREARVTATTGDKAVVQWDPVEENKVELSATYSLSEDPDAIEMEIAVEALQPYQGYELFVSSYFSPYHTPRFALKGNSVDSDVAIRWYETSWYGTQNDEAWPRDDEARQHFCDGRWLTRPSQVWRLGPDHALPLMTQRHKHDQAHVISMARPQDCIGLSGYNGFHNSQYFHLFGRDVSAGDTLNTTVRREIFKQTAEDLDALALQRYQAWIEKDE